MANIVEDAFGRQVAGDLNAIKGLLQSLTQGKMGPATKHGDGDKDMSKVANIVKQLGDLTKEMKQAQKYVEAAIGANKPTGGGRNKTQEKSQETVLDKTNKVLVKSLSDNKQIGGSLVEMAKNIKVFTNLGKSKHSLGVADTVTHELLKDIIRSLGKTVDEAKYTEMLKPKAEADKPHIGGGGGGGAKGGRLKDIEEQTEKYYWMSLLHEVERHLHDFQKALLGLEKGDIREQLFGGMIKDEQKSIKQLRAIAYETAGVTAETHSLQRAYEDIGKTVAVTGFDRSKFQAQYAKNLTKGVKDAKMVQRITATQLNTEKQLGLEAGALGEEFMNWHQAGRMTAMQLADMGRGMRDVARNTGLTQEGLKQAVQSSEGFITNLRNAANLTTTAAKNVLEIAANSQKLGVKQEMEPLLKAMTSSVNLLNEAPKETQTLLFNAASSVGRVKELMQGTILQNKQAMADMARGFENILKRFGVESTEQIDNLTAERKMVLNMQIKSMTGMELGAFRNVIDTMKEGSKTMAMRLDDIHKKLQANLTIEEKLALKEEERRMKTSKALEVMTALDEAAKGAKNMDEALAKFGQRRQEFEKDLNAMGVSWTSNADVMRQAINKAIEGVNTSLKASGKQTLKIDPSSIEQALRDPVAFRELSAQLSKAEQQAATAQKAALDPMSKIEQRMSEVNDTLRNFSNKALGALRGISGELTVIALLLTTEAARVYTDIQRWKNLLKGAMGEMFGRKTPAAAAGAAGHEIAKSAKEIKIENATARDLALSHKANVAQVMQGKVAKQELAKHAAPVGAAAAGAAPAGPATGLMGSIDVKVLEKELESLKQLGPVLRKAAFAIGKAMVGVLALAFAIIAISKGLSQITGIDAKVAIETGATVAAVITTAGLIAAATVGAMYALKAFNKFSQQSLNLELMKAAAKLVSISVGLVALSLAVLLISRAMMKVAGGMDMKKAALIAADVAAVIGSAAAIAGAVVGALYALKALKKSAQMSGAAGAIFKGGLALMLLTPAIVFLASAVIKISQAILGLFGLDAKKAAEVAFNVAGIILAAAAIALSVLGAYAAIAGLGAASKLILKGVPLFLQGVWALTVLTPVMVLLATAVIGITKAMMEGIGASPKEAVQVAKDIASIILSAGAIALAIIAAYAAIVGLGAAAPLMWSGAKLALIGALALMALTPAMILLSVAVIKIADAVATALEIDAALAKEIASNVAGIIWAGATIAGGVLGAATALAILGMFVASGLGLKAALLMVAGAAALRVLTPRIIDFAVTIIKIADEFQKKSKMDAELAKDVAEQIAGIIKGAGTIAFYVMASAAALAMLGSAIVWILLAVPLMMLGAKALKELTPAVIDMAVAIINMADELMNKANMDAQLAKEVVSDLRAIMDASWTIAKEIIAGAAKLALLGVLSSLASLVVGFMEDGTKFFRAIATPVIEFMKSVINLASGVTEDIDPATLQKIVCGFMTVADVASKISGVIFDNFSKLIKLGIADMIDKLFSGGIVKTLQRGAEFFQQMAGPIKDFMRALIESGKQMSGLLEGKAAEETIKGMEKVSKVIEMVNNVMKMLIENLIPLTERKWFGLVKSPLEKLEKQIPDFKAAFGRIAQFINEGVIEPIRNNFRSVKDIALAAQALKGITVILCLIKTMMGQLGELILGITTDPNVSRFRNRTMYKQIAEMVPDFQTAFETIVLFVKDGVITPIRRAFRDIRQVYFASRATKAVSEAIVNTAQMIKTIGESLLPLLQERRFLRNRQRMNQLDFLINEVKPAVERSFEVIVQFVKEGIVRPISRAFRDLKKLQQVMTSVKLVGEIMAGLSTTLDNVSKTLDYAMPARRGTHSLGQKWAIAGQATMEFIGEVLTEVKQLIKKIPKTSSIQDKVAGVKALAEVMVNIIPLLDGLNKWLEVVPDYTHYKTTWQENSRGERFNERTVVTGTTKGLASKWAEVSSQIKSFIESIINMTADIAKNFGRQFAQKGDAQMLQRSVQNFRLVMEVLKGIMEFMEVFDKMVKAVSPHEDAMRRNGGQSFEIISRIRIGLERRNEQARSEGGFVGVINAVIETGKQILDPIVKMTGKMQLRGYEEASRVLTSLGNVFEGLLEFFKQMDEVVKALSDNENRWSGTGEYSFEVISRLRNSLRARNDAHQREGGVGGVIKNLMNEAKRMLGPVMSLRVDVSGMQKAANMIRAMGGMMTAMIQFFEEMDEIVKSISPAEDAGDQSFEVISRVRIGLERRNARYAREGGVGGIMKKVFEEAQKMVQPVVDMGADRELMNKMRRGWMILKASVEIFKLLNEFMEEMGELLTASSVRSGMGRDMNWSSRTGAIEDILKQLEAQEEGAFVRKLGIIFHLVDGIMASIIAMEDTREKLQKISIAAYVLRGLGQVFKMLPEFMDSMNEVTNMLGSNRFWNIGGDNAKVMDQILFRLRQQASGGYKGFGGYMQEIFDNVKKIIDPIAKLGEGKDKVKKITTAAQVMRSVMQVFVNLQAFMEKMNEVTNMLGSREGFWDNVGPDAKIMDVIIVRLRRQASGTNKGFGAYIGEIFDAVKKMTDGIEKAGSPRDIAKSAQVLKSVATIVKSLPDVLKNVSTLTDMVKPGEFGELPPAENILANKDKFKDFFEKTTLFLKEGIVEPISRMGVDPRKVNQTAQILTGVGRTMKTLPEIIQSVGRTIELFDPNVNVGNFQNNLANFINQVANMAALNGAVDKLKAANDQLVQIVRTLQEMARNLTTINGIRLDFRTMDLIRQIGVNNAPVTVGARGNGGNPDAQAAANAITRMGRDATTVGSIYTHDTHMEKIGDALLTKLDSPAQTALANPNMMTPDAITQELEKRRAGEQPQKTVVPGVDDLNETANKSLLYEYQALNVLKDIHRALQPPTTTGHDTEAAVASARTRATTNRPPQFFRWTSGLTNQSGPLAAMNLQTNL
jgi:hypothetical protein